MSFLNETNTQIAKLGSNNYNIWKFRMEMILIKEDLIDLIEQNPPASPDDKYIRRDKKCRALINLFIEDSQVIHVKYEKSARDTWNKLKSIHERANLSSKLFLLRKLYSTKMSEEGNMNEHIAQMLELIDKLKAVGEEIKDEHIAALLLVSVPKSYDHLITALEARPEADLTPELIKNKLVDEYRRRQEQYSDRKTTQAYKSSDEYFKQKQGNRNNKFCTFCKKAGHTRDICYHLQNKNKGISKQQSNIPQGKYNKANQNRTSVCLHTDLKQEAHHSKTQNVMESMICKNDPTKLEVIEADFDDSSAHRILAKTGKTQILDDINITKDQTAFYIDSGATQHLVNDINLFSEINTEIEPVKIIVADGKCLYSKSVGVVHLETKTSDGAIHDIFLKDVYYLPELESNLISVKKITNKGCIVTFNTNKCFIIRDNTVYIEAVSRDNGLYEVILNDIEEEKKESICLALTCNNRNCVSLWHKRLGHRSVDSIKKLITENLAEGIQLDKCSHTIECEECIKNKLCQLPYPKEAKFRAKRPLDLVHSDLCGPMQTPTIGGKYYILTLIDDFSRFTMIYLLSQKSEVLSKIKDFIAATRNKFGRTLKTLRTDNGGEYIGKEIEIFLKDQGITHQLTVPYSPPQNGTAERKNRSLLEMTRCLLSEANLPHHFWGEAVTTANYLQNRLPTKANVKTPFELWNNRKPDLSNIRTFGSKAFAYIHDSKRHKLDQKAAEGILVGYDHRSKGYRIYITDSNVMISRSVRFIEQISKNEEVPIISTKQNGCEDYERMEEISKNDLSKKPRRSERPNLGKPPERLTYYIEDIKTEPRSHQEVKTLNSTEKKKWQDAMDEEMKSLEENDTWELVDLPKGKRPIGCKWTYRSKINELGKIERCKARLVAKGYSQKFGTDYEETFAPVVKHATIRAFLAVSSYHRMYVKHVDIKTAFLHGNLNEEVYMQQPEGYVKPGYEDKVCKLNKAIYGLKQAARAWNLTIAEVLERNKFIQSKADPCLFTRNEDNNSIFIILYVDDLLIASKDELKINTVINALNAEFETKNLGDVKYYLGIDIRRNSNWNFELNQKAKIEELLRHYMKDDFKPTYTPMETSYLKEDDNSTPLTDNSDYRKAIGSLLYVATVTRPDIMLAVNLLSRKNEKPTEKDWTAVIKVIRYLNTTKDLNLVISNEEPVLIGYADADWASDKITRKSTGGNAFFLGKSIISWISKRQNCIALSSTESEYISSAGAAQEIQWLTQLLEDLGAKQTLPVKLYNDNKSCIALSQSAKTNCRTKHIDVKHHYLRHLQEQNIIQLDYCHTKDMIADMMTKPLPRPQFTKLRATLNLIPREVD